MDVEVLLTAKPRPDGKLLGERLLGVTLQPITPELAKEQRLTVDKGLLVVAVDADGPAAKIGVQKKDVLFQVDRFYVTSLDDLGMILEDVKGGQRLPVGIVRGNVRAWAPIVTRQATSGPTSRPAIPPGGERA